MLVSVDCVPGQVPEKNTLCSYPVREVLLNVRSGMTVGVRGKKRTITGIGSKGYES